MVFGEEEHILDNKGRLIIPYKFRQAMGERLGKGYRLTRGLDSCLLLIPSDDFQEISQKLQPTLLFKYYDKEVRRFYRSFLSATLVEPDRLGRVTIPAPLRDYAHLDLENQVVVVGLGYYLELWQKQLWQKFMEESVDSLEKASQGPLQLLEEGFLKKEAGKEGFVNLAGGNMSHENLNHGPD